MDLCIFHNNQIVIRMVQSSGLTTMYRTPGPYQVFIVMVRALSYIKFERQPEAMTILRNYRDNLLNENPRLAESATRLIEWWESERLNSPHYSPDEYLKYGIGMCLIFYLFENKIHNKIHTNIHVCLFLLFVFEFVLHS